MYRVGIRATLWLIAVVVSGGAALWAVCSAWAWLGSKPVQQLVDIRQARSRQNAAGAWRRLRMRVAVSSAAKAGAPQPSDDQDSVERKFKSAVRTVRIAAACAAFSYGVPLDMLGETGEDSAASAVESL
jgi:hypothetical protein